ncbi:MAG: hypothetical protein QM578_10250 [Pantoea sp.]|uniref:hypothetical protein n=1 Tax=Pantoea sp. TaxID=69393 RepID=UPI0039E3282B
MSDGYIGLIGAVVGAFISGGFTWFNDWSKSRFQNKKDLQVLALKLSYRLDCYVRSCIECLEDDGREYYEDEQGQWSEFRGYKVEFPVFTLGELNDVDWKLMSPDLMYKVFDLPSKVGISKQRFMNELDEFDEHYNDDYPTTIREKELTDLGIMFYHVSQELKREAKLPSPSDVVILDALIKDKERIDSTYVRLFINKE